MTKSNVNNLFFHKSKIPAILVFVCDNASWRSVRGVQIPRGRFESTVRLVEVQAHRVAMYVSLLKALVKGWLKLKVKGFGLE